METIARPQGRAATLLHELCGDLVNLFGRIVRREQGAAFFHDWTFGCVIGGSGKDFEIFAVRPVRRARPDTFDIGVFSLVGPGVELAAGANLLPFSSLVDLGVVEVGRGEHLGDLDPGDLRKASAYAAWWTPPRTIR